MPRLIDADALIEELLRLPVVSDDLFGLGFKTAIDCAITKAANAPTIEAKPVRHGRWIPFGQIAEDPFVNNYRCSECDYRVHFRTRYCPDCGWPMDGGVSNEG